MNKASATRLLSPTPLNRSAWSLGAGVRSAIAVCIPLILAEWFQQPGLSWVAIVALWICLTDPGGPFILRVRLLSWFALFSVLECGLAVLVRPYLWLSIAVLLLWCTATSLIRVWGTNAATAGTLLAVNFLVVLGLDQPTGFDAAVSLSLWSIIGAIWAMLIVLVLWRQRPYTPARDAVASVFEALGRYAQALPKLRAGATDNPSGHLRHASRDAIEAARSVLITMQRDRSGQSLRGRHLVLMLADAERVFSVLLAVDEVLAHTDHGPIPPAALNSLGATMLAITTALRTRKPCPQQPDLPLEPDSEMSRLLSRASQWVSAAAEHLDGVTPDTPPPDVLTLPDNPGLLAPLRDNLTFDSLAFRHATRFAVTGAIMVLLTNGRGIERGYWLTMTAVAVLQVYPSATWTRALERSGGSILGGLIAAAAAFVLHGPAQTTLIILPLTVLTMSIRGVNYALFVLFLTPTVVLIAELFQTGGGLTPHLAELRALDSAIGSALGLLASFLLWPSWEAQYIRRRLADDVRSNGEYLCATLLPRDRPDAEAELEEKRRAAGLASNNADASLQRIMGEPRRNQDAAIGAAMIITAASRRMAGVAAALMQIAPDLQAEFHAFHASLSQEIAALVAWIAGEAPASAAQEPAIPEGMNTLLEAEIRRALRQVELIREAAGRLPAATTHT